MLASETGEETLAANHEVQQAEGADIVLLDPRGAGASSFRWLTDLGPDARRLRAAPARAGSMRIRCSACCAARRADAARVHLTARSTGIEREGARVPA